MALGCESVCMKRVHIARFATRLSAILAIACVGYLARPPSASGQGSTYMSVTEEADYSGMTPAGGTIILPYTLLFGEAPPGLGETFNITLTVSPITSYVTGNSYGWPDLPAAPELFVAGLGYPTNIFENLPAGNSNALPLTAGSTTLVPGSNDRLWMEANFEEGNFEFLGEFTITLGDISGLPPDYRTTLELNIFSERHLFLVDGDVVRAGIWATPLPPLEESTTDFANRIVPFGTSVTYRFTAFSDGNVVPITSETPMWNAQGVAQFDAIPEPGSLFLWGAAVVGLLLMRPRSANSA